MPVLLICLLIFGVWLKYETTKATRKDKQASADYWTVEQEANLIRKKDISNLNYIEIPLYDLPLYETSDKTLSGFHQKIHDLSNVKILNLTGTTNTQLKLEYGMANLSILSEYDQNFTALARTIFEWGSYLYEKNNLKDAVTVLEFGVKCRTDISGNYTLLAGIYKEQGNISYINDLIAAASSLSTLMKESILTSLKKIKLE